MSEKSIRDLVVDATSKANEDIREILQKFHDKTGLKPAGVSFELLDARCCGDDDDGFVVINVNIESHT